MSINALCMTEDISQKQLKKTVQRHDAKRLSANNLHFLFDFLQLSEKRLYRLKSLDMIQIYFTRN